MPARDMHFTFDTKVKINKKTVLQFIEDFSVTAEDFKDIKEAFGLTDIDA